VTALLLYTKERAQGLVEYALILVLVSLAVFVALLIFGPLLGNIFSGINSSLAGS
jgi:pilus assembly protein Flp/PilA